MSDVVSGLLTRLTEVERRAEALGGKPWHPDGFYVEEADERDVARFGSKDEAVFVASSSPQSILRLVRAHRQIIDEYRIASQHASEAHAAGAPGHMIAREVAVSGALLKVLELLAEGWGVGEVTQ